MALTAAAAVFCRDVIYPGLKGSLCAAVERSHMPLPFLSSIAFGLAGPGHREGGDALVAVDQNPADGVRHDLGIPGDAERVALLRRIR